MRLIDQIEQACASDRELAHRETEVRAKSAEAKRIAQDLENAKYLEDNMRAFLNRLAEVVVKKRNDRKLVLDIRQGWVADEMHNGAYGTFRTYLFLDKASEAIRNWAITEGLRVSVEPKAQIDIEYDRDHEGGAIRGTESYVYGTRITFEW